MWEREERVEPTAAPEAWLDAFLPVRPDERTKRYNYTLDPVEPETTYERYVKRGIL